MPVIRQNMLPFCNILKKIATLIIGLGHITAQDRVEGIFSYCFQDQSLGALFIGGLPPR